MANVNPVYVDDNESSHPKPPFRCVCSYHSDYTFVLIVLRKTVPEVSSTARGRRLEKSCFYFTHYLINVSNVQ